MLIRHGFKCRYAYWDFQALQTSYSYGPGSGLLHNHVYHNRSFLQPRDESFRLCYLQTYTCRFSDATFCLFSWKVNQNTSILQSQYASYCETDIYSVKMQKYAAKADSGSIPGDFFTFPSRVQNLRHWTFKKQESKK